MDPATSWPLPDPEVLSRLPGLLFFGTLGLFLTVETFAPRRAHPRGRARHAARNVGFSLLFVAVSVALGKGVALAAAAASARGLGLIPALGLSPAASLLVGVVLLDAWRWPFHVAAHKVPLLWRLHRVHHTDPDVDVTTSARLHPVEGALGSLWQVLGVLVLGLPLSSVLAYVPLLIVVQAFAHANIRLPAGIERVLGLVWITPGLHALHHSRRPEFTDSNYGGVFILWDRLFGTFWPATTDPGPRPGLDGFDDDAHQTVAGMLRTPLAATPVEPDGAPTAAARS